jgi:hypothetical protein
MKSRRLDLKPIQGFFNGNIQRISIFTDASLLPVKGITCSSQDSPDDTGFKNSGEFFFQPIVEHK